MIYCNNVTIKYICGDWHDGKHTEMYKAYNDQLFNPSKLLKETRKILDTGLSLEQPSRDVEFKRLLVLEQYAAQQTSKEKAERDIKKAASNAKQAGISFERFKMIAESKY